MWASVWLSAIGVYLAARTLATSSITTYGTFITTGAEYMDVLPKNALSSSNLLSTYTIITEDASSPFAVLECGKKCLSTTGCTSIVLRPEIRLCYFSKLDRCAWTSNYLNKKQGYNFYELSPGNGVDAGKTCFSSCLTKNNGSCDICGRERCSGNWCESCPGHCWEIASDGRHSVSLWGKRMVVYQVQCDYQWQLMWPFVSHYKQWMHDHMKLRVEVEFKDGTVLYYYYEYVQYRQKKLTVGPATFGNYSNWWGAPFNSRKLTNSSSCKSFFYPPGDCVANGVINKEESKSFAWKTGIEELDNTMVKAIRLWATKD